MNVKILLVNPRKKQNIKNGWSIPKGHIEKDMSALQTALLEVEEEANIKLDKNKLMRAKKYNVVYKKPSANKNLILYVYYIDRDELDFPLYNDMILRFYLDKKEIAEAGFFSIEEAKKLIEPSQLKIIQTLLDS